MDQQIDQSHFKPINSGLGFHHAKKLNKDKSFKDTSEIIRTFKEDPAKESERIPTTLSPFYTNSTTTQDIGLDDYQAFEDFDEEVAVLASPGKRLAAWLIDTAILAFSSIIVLGLIMIANGFELTDLTSSLLETPMRWIFLFALIHTFYFMIFEKSEFSTPGKRLMGLFVKTTNDSRLSLDHTLVRAVVGLGNIVTIGFLAIFNFQDKISETQVLEK